MPMMKTPKSLSKLLKFHKRTPSDEALVLTTPEKTSSPVLERTTSKKRLRRTVHFSEDVQYISNNKTPLSQEEKKAAFYSCEELTGIKKDIKETVAFLSRGTCMPSAQSARGLEKWLAPLEFRDHRDCVLRSTLLEQTIQQSEGQVDDELLADASRECSYVSSEQAQARANDDHETVLNLSWIHEDCPLLDSRCDLIFSPQRMGRMRPRRAARTLPAQV